MRRATAARALLAAGAALVLARAAASDGLASRASVAPSRARLGEPVTYRGQIVLPPGAPRYRWLRPDSSATFTWGAPQARLGRGAGAGASDTLQVEAALQVFATGRVAIPGLRVRREDAPASAPEVLTLPVVHLVVEPLVPASDSTADLRPLRGPIAAPWWERVPWGWVAAGVALVALAAVAIARRRRRPAPAVAAAPPDPAAAARAALAALRRRDLPGQGRFVEHALELSLIARRYLEATRVTPRPGDCTPELIAHLREAGFDDAALALLAPLLGSWDRIKYARAEATVDDARRAEGAVGELVDREAPAPPPAPEAG